MRRSWGVRAGPVVWLSFCILLTAAVGLHAEQSDQTQLVDAAQSSSFQTVQPGQVWHGSDAPFLAEVEGSVSYLGQDGQQIQLQLRSDRGGRMRVIVSNCVFAAPEILLNSRVKARGLCRPTLTPGGDRTAGELFAACVNDLSVVEAPESLWLRTPVTTIGLLPIYWAEDHQPRLVHLKGTVAEVQKGRSLILDDLSARIQVQDNTASPSDQGTAVEVLGRLIQREEKLVLCGAVHRAVTNVTGVALPTLTNIEEIRRLKPKDAAREYPVTFRGVVTFVFPGGTRAHIQGDNEGIYMAGPRNSQTMLQVGDVCQVEGRTRPGAFSPVVIGRKVTVLGKGLLPEPLHPVREQLMNGSLDAQWVEVRGVVLTVEDDGDLLVGTRDGNVAARLSGDDTANLTNYIGDIVRVRGTVRPFANAQRQVRSVLLQVPSKLQISVDEPAPADPFNIPLKDAAALSQFDPNAADIQRVKIAGQLLCVYHDLGYVSDGTNGMRFQLRAGAPAEFVAGDRVEVVGFPKLDGPSPLIQDALVRKVEGAPFCKPRKLTADSLLERGNDANLVQVEGILLATTTNHTDQVMEVQTGARTFLARLESERGALPMIPRGSRVRLTGVFIGEGIGDSLVTYLQSFELVLSSPADIVVLDRPSWWTLKHSLAVVGGLVFILGMAGVWIAALHRQVEARTHELKEEIEERKRMEREVERIHYQLLEASRRAGQAEVASSVLHNVGNVLNSVNVSTGVIADALRRLQVANVGKAAGLLQERKDDLEHFLTEDERGRRLPGYLGALGTQLVAEQTDLLQEVKDLAHNVEHMKEIVAMQQSYTKVAGVTETIAVSELVESALKLHAGAYVRHRIEVVRLFEDVPPVNVDKHKVLQILINILHNAKYACDAGPSAEKRVLLRIERASGDRVRIKITDNGMGIPPETLSRLFTHGFTTRPNGNGFGLHSAAVAARELGGTLTAHSDGVNQGATFTLEIPIQHEVSDLDLLHSIGFSEGVHATA